MVVPILAKGLIGVKVSFGTLYNPNLELQLLRGGKVIGEGSVPGTNDRSTAAAAVDLANRPLGTEAKEGDTLRFMTGIRWRRMFRNFLSDSTITLAYKH